MILKVITKGHFFGNSFAPFSTAFHPEMKEHHFCLICRGIGIDKTLKAMAKAEEESNASQ
jgi:hypothetical protein